MSVKVGLDTASPASVVMVQAAATAPGLPPSYPDPTRLITPDCLGAGSDVTGDPVA